MIEIPNILRDPLSVKSLRNRASKLENCPYKLILELVADQLEEQKITRDIAEKAIEYVRTGNPDLLTVAMKMINLNQGQISIALSLLRKMDWIK